MTSPGDRDDDVLKNNLARLRQMVDATSLVAALALTSQPLGARNPQDAPHSCENVICRPDGGSSAFKPGDYLDGLRDAEAHGSSCGAERGPGVNRIGVRRH